MDFTTALEILSNGFADAMQIQMAREFMCQYPMDQLYGYGLDDDHMNWFRANHHHHHRGYGERVTMRRDMFGNEMEILEQRGPFGQRREEIIERDVFGNETIIERDNFGW